MVEGIRSRQQEAAAGIDGCVRGTARQRRRALFAEPAIHANPVADDRKIGPHGGIEPAPVGTYHQRLYLTRRAHQLQELHLSRVGQGKHMDLLAAGAGDINDLLHLISTPCHG